MDSYFLKKQLLAETNETLRIKELNLELTENLSHTSNWILKYAVDNGVKPPNLEKLLNLIGRSRELVENIERDKTPLIFQHPFATPDDSTEPNIMLKQSFHVVDEQI